MMLDRALITTRFGNALRSYDQAATPQLKIIHQLCDMLREKSLPAPLRVLEIGCGTGLLTHQLASLYPDAQLTLVDLVPEAEEWVRKKLPQRGLAFHFGDAETMAWGGAYQLIASSSCIQWWHDPLAFIPKAYQALDDGGWMAVTTFLPHNLLELQTILPPTLHYPEAGAYDEALSPFRQKKITELSYTLHFPTLLMLLRHLKATGTNAFTHSVEGLWTPKRIKEMELRMRTKLQLPADAPLPLTYKALIIIAQR